MMAVVVVHLLSVFSKKTGDIRLSAKCLHPADPSSSHKFIHIFTNMDHHHLCMNISSL